MAFLANEMAMEADELGSIFVLCAVVFSLIVISMVILARASDVETAAEKLNNSPVDEGPKLPRIAGGNGMAMNENRDQLVPSKNSVYRFHPFGGVSEFTYLLLGLEGAEQ
ncbi:hypothetical protein CDL15_Pgr002886 [Punica granatum]|uniref:Uncharacterized protein n=1 Tax=Punica granatum TaxID=22663 RepID=A0A218X0L1_PUNGR|nr:hypothetical protein CDL15_Pgr002886 [Punica granatum]